MAVTQATTLADFTSGIGTAGAILQVDNADQRVGIGTTDPQATLQVGIAITMDGTAGVITATKFDGDGSELTGVISGVEFQFNGTSVGSAVTNIDFVGFNSVTAPVSGLATVTSSKQLTIGVRVGTAVTFSIVGAAFTVDGRSAAITIDV